MIHELYVSMSQYKPQNIWESSQYQTHSHEAGAGVPGPNSFDIIYNLDILYSICWRSGKGSKNIQ